MKIINSYLVNPRGYWMQLYECENDIWVFRGGIIEKEEALKLLGK